MGDNCEQIVKDIRHYQEYIDKYTERRNFPKLLHCIQRLNKLPIEVVHLELTGVGRTVNALRKLGGEVGEAAKGLVFKWKEMVVEQQITDSEEEEEEEDGYETGETGDNPELDSDNGQEAERNASKDKDETIEDITQKNSHHQARGDEESARHPRVEQSHRNVERSRHEEPKQERSKEREKKDKNEDKQRHRGEHSKTKGEDKTKHREDHSKSKSQKKRHLEDHELEEEAKKRHKKNGESTSRKTDEHKKHKKSKHDDEQGKTKERKNDDCKKHKHKDKSRHKDSKEKKDKDKPHTWIASTSGASFAEALGMCGPSSSKKKTSSTTTKKEKTSSKSEDLILKSLKEQPSQLEPMEVNISSLLPQITPNYRPLANPINLDSPHKKILSDYEKLSNAITSKNQRTKVYSGNKVVYGKVSSLFELCTRVLQDNIDALEYTGGVPYQVLKPILEKANPDQLFTLEHHNPYLIEDTDELWQWHCQKDFRNKKREEMETWREMYMRCLDEREAKLKNVTAIIKEAQDKSLPVRTTKLAYVDAVAKPPRGIARKQAKNGTGLMKSPMVTPSARLTTLATAGEAGKVSVPNPGARAVERHSNQVMKAKKAPLMAKSLSLLKNRFRR